MSNPYQAPQSASTPEEGAVLGPPSREQDLGLVRKWLGQSGFVILGVSGAAGMVGSLLLDLQAHFAPESGSGVLGLLNTAIMAVVAVVCIHIAVGRWRKPSEPLGVLVNRGVQTGGRAILPVVLRSLGVVLGLLLFVVPGVILAVRTLMVHAMFALGYQDEGARSLKRAWERSEGQFGELFALGVIGVLPLLFMAGLEGLWQFIAFEQGVGFGVLLAISLPLAFLRAFAAMLLPLIGAARVVGWMKQDHGELHFPWES